MQKSVWIARPSFPFNASFLFRYYTLYLFFFLSFFLFFAAIYYNKKKHNNLGTGYNNEKKFSLYVWPIAHYIYIKISISTSCSELTIIWYSFYLLTSYFEKLSTWIWRFHMLFAINQLLKPVWIALVLNKIGKLIKSAVYKPL